VRLLASAVSLYLPLPSLRPHDMFAVLTLLLRECPIQCMILSSVGLFPVKCTIATTAEFSVYLTAVQRRIARNLYLHGFSFAATCENIKTTMKIAIEI
jgi:alanine-alpha-ketoisovalerate/valine-pyruvate aminotransferase